MAMTTMASTTTMPTVARRGRGRDARARGAAMGCAHRRRVVTLAGGKRGDDGEEKAQDVDERRGMDWDGAWRAFKRDFVGDDAKMPGDLVEKKYQNNRCARAREGGLGRIERATRATDEGRVSPDADAPRTPRLNSKSTTTRIAC
jgi:hypothetical protein|tara:strand:+ start:11779 stop:12213 length:435 start_codon:yes stop_codon:yes gene_type:complete